MQRFSAEFLTAVGTDVFMACGAPRDEANIVAEQLVAANLVGIDSHGVIRIPLYVRWIQEGVIKPGAPISVIDEKGASAVVDCGFNFGQVGGLQAMQVAIEKAREHTTAFVLTRRCNHVGRLGYFVEMASKAGMFALAACNSPRTGHNVVPFGGMEGRLATNPIAYAVPGKDYPLVADISTSTISEGRVRLYHNLGQQLPVGAIIDGMGRPSTDPADFYRHPRGWILPLGGAFGHKGFVLGLLAEILSGTLAGDHITEFRPSGNNGVCFIVINLAAFVPLEQFQARIGEMAAYIKSTPPAPGFQEVMIPGELEFRTLAERRKNGIPVEPTTWRQIQETAAAVGIQIPQPV